MQRLSDRRAEPASRGGAGQPTVVRRSGREWPIRSIRLLIARSRSASSNSAPHHAVEFVVEELSRRPDA